MIVWIVVGLIGFGVWIHGILALGDGKELPGGLEVLLGGMLMFIVLNMNPWRQRRRNDRDDRP